MEQVIPPERLETCWSSGEQERTRIYHYFRLDGARDHHGLH